MLSPRQEIRQHIRKSRSQLPAETRTQLSQQISQRVLQLESYQRSNTIAAFLAFEGEADPIHLMNQAVLDGKQVFVPVVLGKSKPLRFARWTPDTPQSANRFGILEPQVDQSEMLNADQLDFVVTPLVAFDRSCNRIGVGGGYYDRSFSFLNDREVLSDRQRPLLCGFAFAIQQVETIEPATWDVPLDFVATESELISQP